MAEAKKEQPKEKAKPEKQEKEAPKDSEGEISAEGAEGKAAFPLVAFVKRNKILVICLGVFLIVLIVVAVIFFLRSSQEKAVTGGMASSEWMGSLYPLEVVMNLKPDETETLKYVEIGVTLEMDNDDLLEEVEDKKTRMTDILLSFIGEKRADEINSIPEQNRLKRRIKDLINAHLFAGRVVNVYFTKFKITEGSAIRPINALQRQ